jgi:8-oxo-dGTP pyrophosphatase MutT (NUDIX family)
VPEDERNDLIRVFFQIEIAHWFYLDFYCDNSSLEESSFAAAANSSSSYSSSSMSSFSSLGGSSDDNDDDDDDEDEFAARNLVKQRPAGTLELKPCSMRVFAERIFRYCPFLMQHSNNVHGILSEWIVFKHAVPTNGAIILDESMRNVLLVQGFWAKASWGFPKGKILEEESEANCAIREVLEETGFDITDRLDEDRYLQINVNDKVLRLYIITNVPLSTRFEPRTRREIREIKWFPVNELPFHRKDNRTIQNLGYSSNSFFMVIPFVK